MNRSRSSKTKKSSAADGEHWLGHPIPLAASVRYLLASASVKAAAVQAGAGVGAALVKVEHAPCAALRHAPPPGHRTPRGLGH